VGEVVFIGLSLIGCACVGCDAGATFGKVTHQAWLKMTGHADKC
jgi:hypothetical protein